MDVFAVLDMFSAMLFVKLLILVLLTVYLAFAYLIMKKIATMTRAVQMQDDYIIRGLGIFHFGFAMLTWIVAALSRVS